MAANTLESGRSRFLDQLHSPEFTGEGTAEFMSYWRSIEVEAKASEDLGQLDAWVKEISKDKDRVMELRARQQQAASSQMGDAEMLGLLTRILITPTSQSFLSSSRLFFALLFFISAHSRLLHGTWSFLYLSYLWQQSS